MSVIVDAFRLKPFDLEPVYQSWPSAPIFQGVLSRDPPVDDWLKQIKEGSVARGVPKEYWHKVGQHYLGQRARARFDELKAVMKNMHGGKYHWNWKRFKVAMRNMGWDIDTQKTEEIKVRTKPSGIWWIPGRGSRDDSDKDSDTASISSLGSVISKDAPSTTASTGPSSYSDAGSTRPTPKKSMSWDFSHFKGFPMPRRSATMSSVDTVSSLSSSETLVSSSPPRSEKVREQEKSSPPPSMPTPEPAGAGTPGEATAQVPTWLLHASQALSFLTTEHPKTMTAISAVLITIGSIPALPAIHAGAGGAFLASTTAQAIGSIAIGMGSLLKAVNDPKKDDNTPAQK